MSTEDFAQSHVLRARVGRAQIVTVGCGFGGLFAAEPLRSTLAYDHLILAPGAVESYFGHEEWSSFASGLNDIGQATYIHSRLLLSFEIAELEEDPGERAAHPTFVIIGGSPTGVDLAGAIKELAVDVMPRYFRSADTRRARVLLIEAGPRLLSALHPHSSARSLKQLRGLGVEVLLGAPVMQVFADGVEAGGKRMYSHNVIWAAGVRAAPLAGTLGVAPGPGGRVLVLPDYSVPGHPNAFVIGDAAWLVDRRTGQPVPGVLHGAIQMGRYVARVIEAELRAAPMLRARGFHYRDRGLDGDNRQIASRGGTRLSAFRWSRSWLAWLALHVTVLIGFRNCLAVLSSWAYNYVFFRRGSRLITGFAPPTVRPHDESCRESSAFPEANHGQRQHEARGLQMLTVGRSIQGRTPL